MIAFILLLFLSTSLAEENATTISEVDTLSTKGCKIEGDKVVINGVSRPLTSEEKRELADYTIALDQYFKKAFHPRAQSSDRIQTPKFPKICKDDPVESEHHVTSFDGCSITDNQLYLDGKFVRELTEKEKKELESFREGIEQFKATIDDFIRGHMQAALKGKLPSNGKQPQPPTPPKICPSSKQQKKIKTRERSVISTVSLSNPSVEDHGNRWVDTE